MSSSAKMVLVSQVQGSAMAMQSAWMDLMNKTVVSTAFHFIKL